MIRKRRIEKTRNCGTMTNAQYFSMIRSGLRRTFRFWKPIQKTREKARRIYEGPNKRQKWEYQCAACKKWFKGNEVQVDHVTPVGSLNSLEDLPGFVERLSSEDPSNYQVLCKTCHSQKSKEETLRRKEIKNEGDN